MKCVKEINMLPNCNCSWQQQRLRTLKSSTSFEMSASKMACSFTAFLRLTLLYFTILLQAVNGTRTCHQHRTIYSNSTGIITDGQNVNYKQNTICEWLIRANKSQTITLTFTEFDTECSYDFLFIYDGPSYSSPLLGSFSGNQRPDEITSSSHEMLIHLFSDTNYARPGFTASYTVHDCPRGCSGKGVCTDGKTCICTSSFKGDYCELHWCPDYCGLQYGGRGTCDTHEERCKCNTGYYGASCSVSSKPNSVPNTWHTISYKSSVFKARASHIAVYMEDTDRLWVHGGYSFNEVFSDVLYFNFTLNEWEKVVVSGQKPSARYQHTGIRWKDGIVIFGGELSNGSLSNELWIFNTKTKIWTQPLGHQTGKPPGLAGHSANIVDNSLYIFGGRTDVGGFSSDVYKFSLNSQQGWKKLVPRGGKSVDLRMFGHSSVYHQESRSLIIFGGLKSGSLSQPAKKTNVVLSFHIDELMWTTLSVSSSSAHPLPKALAFHSALIFGNYMVVYGGYTHEHGQDETCYSNDLWFYNLKCNIWVSKQTLTNHLSQSGQAVPRGRYYQAAVIKEDQTLLIIGGFNGRMLGDIVAYKVPDSVLFKNALGVPVEGQHCSKHDEKNHCHYDPSCGWCYKNMQNNVECFAAHDASKCTAGLFDTSYCNGDCSAYTQCESCLVWGKNRNPRCSWCVQDGKCYPASSPKGLCSPSKAMGQKGWWGNNSTLLNNPEQCATSNIKPGLTLIHDYETPHPDFPDIVTVLPIPDYKLKVKYDFGKWFKQSFKIKGFVYPFLFESDPARSKLRQINMISKLTKADLYLSTDDSVNLKEKVATTMDNPNSVTAVRQSGQPLFPNPKQSQDYYLEFSGEAVARKDGQSLLSWNLTDSPGQLTETIQTKYLKPFFGKNCSAYPTCMACVTDMACGWCSSMSSCLSTSSWSSCKDSDNQVVYLAKNQTLCTKCNDFYDCSGCLKNSYCSWDQNHLRCVRQGISSSTFTSNSLCAPPCYRRSSCTSCLADKECTWCRSLGICFPFSHYLTRFTFGQCSSWTDRNTAPVAEACGVCSRHTTCGPCLADHQCGWCGNVDNPRIGVCRGGDYNGPKELGNCSVILATNESVAWSYDRCPDVDECRLGLDDCNGNATCYNTDGSYICKCNRGYTGNGKQTCDQTCYHDCIKGYCGSDYQCKCDLGWIGVNCSIDCGCHGHSTCNKGVGICDACHNYTRGNFCESCVPESYGNATTAIGCNPCQCNGHGDPDKGLCDIQNGKCFCIGHTVGDHCENCMPGLAGNPLNGGFCYYKCSHKMTITNTTEGTLSNAVETGGTENKNCVWFVSASNRSKHEIVYNQSVITPGAQVVLSFEYLSVHCQESHIHIYDGVPPNPRGRNKSHSANFTLLGVVCGYDVKKVQPFVATTGTLGVVYKGVSPGTGQKGTFIAKYVIHKCPNSCHGNRICRNFGAETRCVCKDGWTGVKCDTRTCPQNCSSHGVCSKELGYCICAPGYTGLSCNETVDERKFIVIETIGSEKSQNKPLGRYGHTMNYYSPANLLVVFGGQSLSGEYLNDLHFFNLGTKSWKLATSSNGLSLPGLSWHCSAIYKDAMVTYGGLTSVGLFNKMHTWNFTDSIWAETKINLPAFMGHSCTIVNDLLYVIGGYRPNEGLNEYTLIINMVTSTWSFMKVKGDDFPPAGIYAHSAVYYEPKDTIFVYGGLAFYKEKVQPSDRLYSFHLSTRTWNFHESSTSIKPPSVYFHTTVLQNETMIVIGGFAHNKGFNGDIFVFQVECNQWLQLNEKVADVYQERILSLGLGSAAVVFNQSLYLFGGFIQTARGTLLKINPPSDICMSQTEKEQCTGSPGCNWCKNIAGINTTVNSICFGSSKKVPLECSNGTITTSAGTCNRSALEESVRRGCSLYKSCASCLATFPSSFGPQCTWCSCAYNSGCLPSGSDCASHCHKRGKLSVCNEVRCEASSCPNCVATECMWTRHFKYADERNRTVKRTPSYDWNCFMKVLLTLEGAKDVNITDIYKCPIRCSEYTSCSSCLTSTGADGGTQSCIWSGALAQCMSPTYVYSRCVTGNCGLLYSDKTEVCPKPCSYQTCGECLQNPECGWCAKHGIMGIGVCVRGSISGPQGKTCNKDLVMSGTKWPSNDTTDLTVWAPLTCPLENECLNHRHNCETNQDCIDLPDGFMCRCKIGYEIDPSSNECKPVCEDGCGNGICIAPNVCSCHFGWTGRNCTVKCECNGHSNCPNETHPDICLKCHNNTQGPSCEKCEPLFVGDPKSAEKEDACVSCFKYCNGKSSICMTTAEYERLPESAMKNKTEALRWLKHGPNRQTGVICADCSNFSQGNKCESCIDGYFDRNGTCTQCQCNGHWNSCDKSTGERCKCGQNTQSDPNCKQKEDCWKKQCSVCKDNFLGTPIDGKQCYKTMSAMSTYTIGTETHIMGSVSSITPLPPNRTVFFAVPPKFTNVEIRLTIDIFQGAADVLLGNLQSYFVVQVNYTTGEHQLKLVPPTDRKRRSVKSSKDTGPIDVPIHVRVDESVDNVHNRQRRSITPSPIIQFDKISNADNSRLSTFIEYDKNTLRVNNVQKRLTITIPSKYHNFRLERFFVGVLTRGSAKHSEISGLVYFRQDLSQIDLFVFFSVFFSIFFLILSTFVVVWKMKQYYRAQHAARVQQFELETMASRPFSSYTLRCERNETIRTYKQRYSKLLANRKVNTDDNRNDDYNGISPLAVENTADNLAAVVTVMIQFPENEESKWNFALGSGLASATTQRLVQVSYSNEASSGRKVGTRFMNTVTT